MDEQKTELSKSDQPKKKSPLTTIRKNRWSKATLIACGCASATLSAVALLSTLQAGPHPKVATKSNALTAIQVPDSANESKRQIISMLEDAQAEELAGNISLAKEKYEQSTAIASDSKVAVLIALTQSSLGRFELTRSEDEDAIKNLESAISTAPRTADGLSIRINSNNLLGNYEFKKEDYSKALPYFTAAYGILKRNPRLESQNPDAMLTTANNYAETLARLNRPKAALPLFKESIREGRRLNADGDWLGEKVISYARFCSAHDLQDEAVMVMMTDLARCAQAYSDKSKFRELRDYCSTLIDSIKREPPTQQAPLLKKCIDLLLPVKMPHTFAMALMHGEYAQNLAKSGSKESAAAEYRKAITILKDLSDEPDAAARLREYEESLDKLTG